MNVPLCDITIHKDHDKRTRQVKRRYDDNKTEDEESNDRYEESIYEQKENEENTMEEELSDYEKMLRKNREAKMALLESLGVKKCKEELTDSVKKIAIKRKTSKSFKKPKSAEVVPLRKSNRLAKIDVNLSEAELYKRSLEEAEKEMEKKKLPRQYAFENAIQDKDGYSKFVNDFSLTAKSEGRIHFDNNYDFKQMVLSESCIAKVVPSRVTAITVHPVTDKIIITAGDKYGNLGFWNVTSDAVPIIFTPHIEGITNLKINPYNSLQIVSSSYDGTMRCGDIEKKVFNEIYNISEETSCTFFDFLSSNTFLVAQRNGKVALIDIRNDSLQGQKQHHCHDYGVKTVSVHPLNKNLFLTADTKGTMKLWDLRKLQKKPLIQISHHRRSISSAFFSPATGKSIVTTSLDDTLCLFDSSKVEKEILYDIHIRHNNNTGRWLSPFKATWLPNSDEYFVAGSMDSPRRIEIYNTKGHNVYNFKDENLSSITSLNQFHPSLNVLAGANSSGKVFVFIDKKLKF